MLFLQFHVSLCLMCSTDSPLPDLFQFYLTFFSSIKTHFPFNAPPRWECPADHVTWSRQKTIHLSLCNTSPCRVNGIRHSNEATQIEMQVSLGWNGKARNAVLLLITKCTSCFRVFFLNMCVCSLTLISYFLSNWNKMADIRDIRGY